jgi:hypothetical protein
MIPTTTFSSVIFLSLIVLLGGEGTTETLYLENEEHLPFNFSFEKSNLIQLEGTYLPDMTINVFD